jgi:hypothetical protein
MAGEVMRVLLGEWFIIKVMIIIRLLRCVVKEYSISRLIILRVIFIIINIQLYSCFYFYFPNLYSSIIIYRVILTFIFIFILIFT